LKVVERGDRVVTYKYSFLYSYFLTLFIIDGVSDPARCEERHRLKAYAKLAEGSTPAYKDVLQYCLRHSEKLDFLRAFSVLRRLNGMHDPAIMRATSFFVHLYIDIHRDKLGQREMSGELLNMFRDDPQQKVASGLFICGNTVPLDFVGWKIVDSGFIQYANFLRSDMRDATFSRTTVDIEPTEDECVRPNGNGETFDATCSLGRLGDYLKGSPGGSGAKETALRRFLRQFFSDARFREKLVEEVIAPGGVSGEGDLYRHALSQHVMYQTHDGRYCGVAPGYEKTVHDYLVNNIRSKKLAKLLGGIRGAG
jgi:hypothetical protein